MTLAQWILWEAKNAQKDARNEAQLIRKVRQIFARLSREIRKEVEAFYARYGIEGLADAQKVADLEERVHFNERNLTRLQALNGRIQEHIAEEYGELDAFFTENLTDITQTELNRQEKALGFLAGAIIGRQIAKAITERAYYNATYKQRLAVERELQGLTIEQTMLQELIRGGDVKAAVKKIQESMGLAEYQAERLLRTEAKRAQTEATREAYEAAGVKEFQFCANPDCCEICQQLNGRRFKVRDMTAGENAPPIHPNCKCWTIPVK